MDVNAMTDAERKRLIQENLKTANSQLEVMEFLDKAKLPIEATVYLVEGKFTYRNDGYRKMVSEMDLKGKDQLKQFVKSHDVKLMDKLFGRKK